MRTLIFIMTVFTSNLFSQNNIRLVNTQGKIFKVILNEKVQNKNAQAEVLIENIKVDSVHFKIEFENAQRYGATVYLMEKGKPTNNKEFDFKIELSNNKLQVTFTGVYDALILPKPLVPKTPMVELNQKSLATNSITTTSQQKASNKECISASDEKTISDFAEKLKAETDDGIRIRNFKKEYAQYCFNKHQVILILKSFTHDREKLDVAKLLYVYCIEKASFKSISEVFSYNQYTTQLDDFLKTQVK